MYIAEIKVNGSNGFTQSSNYPIDTYNNLKEATLSSAAKFSSVLKENPGGLKLTLLEVDDNNSTEIFELSGVKNDAVIYCHRSFSKSRHRLQKTLTENKISCFE